MSKVEELRDQILSDVEYYWLQNHECDESLAAKSRVFALIAAVRDDERAYIKAEALKRSKEFMEKNYCFVDWILVPPDLLATKESEK